MKDNLARYSNVTNARELWLSVVLLEICPTDIFTLVRSSLCRPLFVAVTFV